jgi:enoyl-CoA hydratase
MTTNYEEFAPGFKLDLLDSGVMRLTFDGPDGNTLTEEMCRDMTSIWPVLERDSDVRSVLVTGAGDSFAAGSEEGHIHRQVTNYEYRTAVMRDARDLIHNILRFSKPFVSAMQGPVASAALAVGLLADISIAAKSTVIFDGHVPLFGVAAGDHVAMSWPLLCGMAKTKYYALTGEAISGEEAERIGLVALCVDDSDLQTTATKIATSLAQKSPSAVAWTKGTLNHWYQMMMPTFEASLALEFYGIGGPDIAQAIGAGGGYRGDKSPLNEA